MAKKQMVVYVGRYCMFVGFCVAISSFLLMGSRFYVEQVFDNNYFIARLVLVIRTLLGCSLISVGNFLIQLKKWTRLFSIYISIGCIVLSVYFNLRAGIVQLSFFSVPFYTILVVLLMTPKVKEQLNEESV